MIAVGCYKPYWPMRIGKPQCCDGADLELIDNDRLGAKRIGKRVCADICRSVDLGRPFGPRSCVGPFLTTYMSGTLNSGVRTDPPEVRDMALVAARAPRTRSAATFSSNTD